MIYWIIVISRVYIYNLNIVVVDFFVDDIVLVASSKASSYENFE